MVPYFLPENSDYFQEKRKSSIFHEQSCLALHVSKRGFFSAKGWFMYRTLYRGKPSFLSKSMVLVLLWDLYWITYCSREPWDERKLMKVPPAYFLSILCTLFLYCKKIMVAKLECIRHCLLSYFCKLVNCNMTWSINCNMAWSINPYLALRANLNKCRL